MSEPKIHTEQYRTCSMCGELRDWTVGNRKIELCAICLGGMLAAIVEAMGKINSETAQIGDTTLVRLDDDESDGG